MTWYLTKKILKTPSKYYYQDEFGKIAGYKIYIQKSVAFLYTNNEESEREIKETIPFTMTSKSIKYLEINVSKEVKDLYLENCETPPLRQKAKRK